ncbi:hypothetical protein [Azospirillum sp.]|uniref:hypothetical protein n=1 Tax=Azospirillum sp. TaxID=34012 RepID=UPI003D74AA95
MLRVGLVMAVLALGPMEAAAACLRYDAPEQLAGTLTRRPVPGVKGPQVYWYLRLDRPACVDAKPGSAGVNAARDAVREIQLELPHEVYSRVVSLPDTRVVAAGTLFGANPGPHATPVMMRVRELRRADAR